MRRSELCLGGAGPGGPSVPRPPRWDVGWGGGAHRSCSHHPLPRKLNPWSGGLQHSPLPRPPPAGGEAPDPVFSPLPGREGGRGRKASLPAPPWRGGSSGSGKGDPLQTLPPSWSCPPLSAPVGGSQARAQKALLAWQVLFPAGLWSPLPPSRCWMGRVRKKRKKISAGEHPHSPAFPETLVSITEGRRRAVQISGAEGQHPPSLRESSRKAHFNPLQPA